MKAFKVSAAAAANGLFGKSPISIQIYFHKPPFSSVDAIKFFHFYFILGALYIFPPSSPIFGLQSGLFTRPTIIHHFPSNEPEGLSIITLPTQ